MPLHFRLISIAAIAGAVGACGDDGGNIEFSSSCEVAACGGDPIGSWEFTGACIENYDDSETDCSDPTGDISGTIEITESGYSEDVLVELQECSFLSESDSGGGGSATITGDMLTFGSRQFAFCVDGDTLQLEELSDLEDTNDPTSFTLRRR